MADNNSTHTKSFGIYFIVNTVTETVYVGATRKAFSDRNCHHWTLLRQGKHKNSRLQRSWNKYGPIAFEFRIVETIDEPDQVVIREQHYLDLHFGNNCFNARPKAEDNSGWNPTQETRLRMSEASKRRGPSSEESRIKLSASCMGLVRNKWTAESRAKLSKVKTGVKRGKKISDMLSARNRKLLEDPVYRAALVKRATDPATIEASRQATQKTYAGTFVSPDGREFSGVVNLSRFCKEHGISDSTMSMVTRGLKRHYKGWTYRQSGENGA